MNIEFLRSLVRPSVTWLLVVVQSTLAVGWATGTFSGAESAFAALSPFTMLVLVYYFKERTEEHDREERTKQ